MLNTRLIYGNRSTAADKTTDFYVDQDFRRIGVLKDPQDATGSAALTSDTASGTFAAIIDTSTVQEFLQRMKLFLKHTL